MFALREIRFGEKHGCQGLIVIVGLPAEKLEHFPDLFFKPVKLAFREIDLEKAKPGRVDPELVVLRFAGSYQALEQPPRLGVVATNSIEDRKLFVQLFRSYVDLGFFVGIQGPLVKFFGVREIVFLAIKISICFEDLAAQKAEIIKLAK